MVDLKTESVLPVIQGAGPWDSSFKAQRITERSITNVTSNIAFSDDSSMYAVGTLTNIVVKSTKTHEIIKEFPLADKKRVYFSPKNTYIIASTYFDSNAPENVHIYSMKTGELIRSFSQRSESATTFQWTADESHFCHMSGAKVIFYNGTDLSKKLGQVEQDALYSFSVSPQRNELPHIALFSIPKKGKPGKIAIYNIKRVCELSKIPNLKINPLSSKTFFKGTSATLKWNSKGTSLLCWTVNETGATADSYYDESFLYLLKSDTAFDCVVPFDNKYPIHDVVWAPNSNDFITLQGEARCAKGTIWAATDCSPIKELGTGPWNKAQFSPQGRFLALYGFGNLAGQIEVWDTTKLLRLCSTQDMHSPSLFQWAPDGRHFLVATLYPRLRVGNQFKIYKYDGTVLYVETAPSNLLYQTSLFSENNDIYPNRPASPVVLKRSKELTNPTSAASVAAAATTGKSSYVPPHLRNKQGPTTSAMKVLQNEAASGPLDILKAKKKHVAP